jgi:hypothetical protein
MTSDTDRDSTDRDQHQRDSDSDSSSNDGANYAVADPIFIYYVTAVRA